MAHDHQPPSFYRFLMNPSSPHLPLPLNFVKKHLNNKILEKPILKSANGGYSWKLEMKKIDDSFCFVDGWSEVVKDVGLFVGASLLFKYVEPSVFLMHVYSGVDGCEKILVPRINNFEVVDDDDDDDDEAGDAKRGEYAKFINKDDKDDDRDDMDDDDDDDPSFILTCSDKFRFKADFVALAGINTKENITLKNVDGYEKELRVGSHRRNQRTYYFLSEGWKEFQQNCNISEGDKFVFKFIKSEDKFCVAKITKNTTPARPLPPVTEVVDGMDDNNGKDVVVGDNNDEDDDRDVDGDDGDPSFKDMDDNDVMDANEEVELFYDEVVEDENEDIEPVADADPSFVVDITTTHKSMLDVVVDDNKEEDENVKPVDDGMYGKDVVVDDNKDEDENVKSVDGMDVVVGDDKDEDENVEFVDDGMDVDADDNKDVAKDAEFVVTITPSHKKKLVLPKKFVVLARIESKENIIMKSLNGNETRISVRMYMRFRSTCYHHLSVGWPAFKRSNDISEGDECVFKYTTSEDKMSLAKLTKKITPPTDDDKKDENKDAEFVVTMTPIHKSKLGLPKDFVVLAGIESKENIIMKSLDGNETKLSIWTDKRQNCPCYYLSAGWTAFKRSNNLSEGDKCVFKYITSEDRLCLAKFTESPPTQVEDKMCVAKVTKEKTQTAEVVKRKRGRLPPSSPRVTKDVKRKKGVAEGVDEVAKKGRGRMAK